MDKLPRKITISMIVTCVAIIAGVMLLFIVPGATRVSMVASMGIHAANTIRTLVYIVGVLLVAAGAFAGAKTTQWVITGRRNATAKALAARSPYNNPPAKSETDPIVIGEYLRRMGEKYPSVRWMINDATEQLDLIQGYLQRISEVFKANPGLTAQGDAQYEFGKFETLLERVLKQAVAELIPSIYQSFLVDDDTSDASMESLSATLQLAIKGNQPRVNQARKLATNMAGAITQVDADKYGIDATRLLQELNERLATTEREEVL